MKNTWLFPAIESLHLIAMAVVIGIVVLTDLRVLGWLAREPAQLQPPLQRWTRPAFTAMFLTGFAMFYADPARYTHNAAFLIKMALLAVTLVFHGSIHLRERKWSAALSLVLWSAVIVCGRLIADFDI